MEITKLSQKLGTFNHSHPLCRPKGFCYFEIFKYLKILFSFPPVPVFLFALPFLSSLIFHLAEPNYSNELWMKGEWKKLSFLEQKPRNLYTANKARNLKKPFFEKSSSTYEKLHTKGTKEAYRTEILCVAARNPFITLLKSHM